MSVVLKQNIVFADKENATGLLSEIKKLRRGAHIGCVIYLILLKAVKVTEFTADLILVEESKRDTDIVVSVVSQLVCFLKSNNVPEEDKNSIIKEVEYFLKLHPEKERSGQIQFECGAKRMRS